jgi:hypothetical protein
VTISEINLYKFRPLATCQDLSRAQEILETGQFWCSRFWELNDPMEGVYWFKAGMLTDDFIRELYGEKSKRAICSFSGDQAFENPIMWGHYANGFKGIAIEIEVGRDRSNITRVNYTTEIANLTNGDQPTDAVKRILTTKLCCWSYEDEFRYLVEKRHGARRIGRITNVFFGNPYKTTVNAEDAQSRPPVREYLCRLESLKQTAHDQGIACHQIEIVKGRVQKYNHDQTRTTG